MNSLVATRTMDVGDKARGGRPVRSSLRERGSGEEGQLNHQDHRGAKAWSG